MSPATLVMARAPRPGACKTRLEPLLGREGCVRLQGELIRHTVRVAPAPVHLAATGELDGLAAGAAAVFPQRGAHLGERLAHAVARVGTPVVVVGTDLPSLRAQDFADAAGALAGADVVLGPAADGGYWLVALARPAPALFAIDPASWGGPRVLQASLMAARAAGLSVALLDERRDLDDADDARAALADPATPLAIARCLSAPASRPAG